MKSTLLRTSDRDLRSAGRLPAPLRAKMHISTNVRTLCSRVHTLIRQRRRKEQQRSMQISAPFNLKHEPVQLPGISEDEIAMLRDQAAASRIGIADPALPTPLTPRSPYSTSSVFSRPPPMSALTAHATTSTETLP
ncbi:hypothetical protein EDB81DRAFT_329048 [Dactylonectria macrodidyma]|uniref:Uncharacterized protein n=1 Tax=Dactylonectria macrodidyma TaxID=307937 RepID=A0A9P9JCY4_9HYPO|nr:hypothetical protein EDB81DRAFT_329048 [Dactylonectria macrodidyma]